MARSKTHSRKKNARSGKSTSGGGISRILGLLLLLVLLGGGAFLYLNPEALDEIKIAAGLAEAPAPAPAPSAGNPANTAPMPATEADPAAADTLNTAKMMVNMRVKEGKALADINEPFKLSANEKQHWQSLQISQGTISAVHINGSADHPMVLLPMQNGSQLVWVCAGDIPTALESVCSQ